MDIQVTEVTPVVEVLITADTEVTPVVVDLDVDTIIHQDAVEDAETFGVFKKNPYLCSVKKTDEI